MSNSEANKNVPLQETGRDGEIRRSVLDVDVSFFENYQSVVPKTINLLKFLTKRSYVKEVTIIRETNDKKIRDMLKARIGAITTSGVFTKRKADALIKHNRLVQFDIDFKENGTIGNYGDLKKQICNISNVAYCGLSVSGLGYWGLIPIAYPEKHKEHFAEIYNAFKRLGIIIDQSCKDVSRLRGYSYDEEAYFNHQAEVFYLYEERKVDQNQYQPSESKKNTGNSKLTTIEKILFCITEKKVDVTINYQTWFELGCSLANSFGESGRKYYHQISLYHSTYDHQKTDIQYDSCLSNGYGYKFGTLVFHCKNAGITF